MDSSGLGDSARRVALQRACEGKTAVTASDGARSHCSLRWRSDILQALGRHSAALFNRPISQRHQFGLSSAALLVHQASSLVNIVGWGAFPVHLEFRGVDVDFSTRTLNVPASTEGSPSTYIPKSMVESLNLPEADVFGAEPMLCILYLPVL